MLTTWAPYDSLSLLQNNIANTHEEPGSTEIKALFFIPVLIPAVVCRVRTNIWCSQLSPEHKELQNDGDEGR